MMNPHLMARHIRNLILKVRWGAGTPEAAVTAPKGTLFLRTDGAANTTAYIKTTGTGNTGWTAISSA